MDGSSPEPPRQRSFCAYHRRIKAATGGGALSTTLEGAAAGASGSGACATSGSAGWGVSGAGAADGVAPSSASSTSLGNSMRVTAQWKRPLRRRMRLIFKALSRPAGALTRKPYTRPRRSPGAGGRPGGSGGAGRRASLSWAIDEVGRRLPSAQPQAHLTLK
ncbi:MAG: hypothetical protein DI526_04275 [Caulobacter segnis]|uniref:Uncharacterized protein n=1 Tax=Caulobacter segnis TaxID=88688 RepID=A0A2W5WQ09_9CAUL|nr:MAG: hypothetical protein DI526_04275 [Caulobacter segnis]